MTYSIDGEQVVVLAVGSNLMAFSLGSATTTGR
jgi:hypothetical protein